MYLFEYHDIHFETKQIRLTFQKETERSSMVPKDLSYAVYGDPNRPVQYGKILPPLVITQFWTIGGHFRDMNQYTFTLDAITYYQQGRDILATIIMMTDVYDDVCKKICDENHDPQYGCKDQDVGICSDCAPIFAEEKKKCLSRCQERIYMKNDPSAITLIKRCASTYITGQKYMGKPYIYTSLQDIESKRKPETIAFIKKLTRYYPNPSEKYKSILLNCDLLILIDMFVSNNRFDAWNKNIISK